jgi:hypothetical protein
VAEDPVLQVMCQTANPLHLDSNLVRRIREYLKIVAIAFV